MKNNDLGVPNLRDDGKGTYVTICGREIFLHDFPKMLEIYFHELMDSDLHYSLEKLGDNLYQKGFSPENQDVPCFVTRVCEWGGHRGRIYGRVLQTPYEEIADVLNKAADFVRSKDVAAALEAVDGLYGLGISYASKHLRMMCSQECVAYDKFLMGEFSECYGNWNDKDYEGYAKFCALFVELAKILNKGNIRNQERDGGEWRAADIEAAIFCKYHSHTKPIVADAIEG